MILNISNVIWAKIASFNYIFCLISSFICFSCLSSPGELNVPWMSKMTWFQKLWIYFRAWIVMLRVCLIYDQSFMVPRVSWKFEPVSSFCREIYDIENLTKKLNALPQIFFRYKNGHGYVFVVNYTRRWSFAIYNKIDQRCFSFVRRDQALNLYLYHRYLTKVSFIEKVWSK